MQINPDGTLRYYQKEKQWNRQRFCSISCSKMLENPMFQPTALKKMKTTQNRRKPQISNRTGNGHIIATQKTVLSFLSDGWKTEYVITTTLKQREEGAPHAYKVDLGMPERKFAIELDGRSHQASKVRRVDKMKMRHLTELGWSVLRLSNSKALSLFTISK